MNRFVGKLFLRCDIETLTGLHIGGTKDSVEIGGLDNPVIKTIDGKPYIPASSLKGKIRCLLERKDGVQQSGEKGNPCGCGNCEICQLFGAHSDKNKTITRLCFRDAFLNYKKYIDLVKSLNFLDEEEIPLTEEKMENIIDRLKGTAKHPRPMERVPAGATFTTKIILNFYEGDDIERLIRKLWEGLRLLEDDYLGGSGTRGYGEVAFRNLEFSLKTRTDYEGNNQAQPIFEEAFATLQDADLKIDELCTEAEKALLAVGGH
ncbi:MAG: CRISPR-associated protein Csm3 [Candidatus Atribacteria bacterium]|nr:CRISPR-associated protein Csm3 [Candidatus Atribacteria bacterium]